MLLLSPPALALNAAEGLETARQLYKQGAYYQAARFSFASISGKKERRAKAYAWLSRSLVKSGLYHSASYFFIRTLQKKSQAATRVVLKDTEELLLYVGVDLLRKYLTRLTKNADYDSKNLGAYLYAIGKADLLRGKFKEAITTFNKMNSRSRLYAYAMQMRGTARAILGQNKKALSDFRTCAARADDLYGAYQARLTSTLNETAQDYARKQRNEARDLRARCQAGEGRTYYQMKRFRDADRAYDLIEKASFVWPDTLFEQAWNAFSRKEYNRALGKLVSYKSPALRFVHNTEIDVLRAQSYMALCLYADANQVINEFNKFYPKLGIRTKRFISKNQNNIYEFYRAGKKATSDRLHTKNAFNRLLNRFVRSPYFRNLVVAEKAISAEGRTIPKFDLQISEKGPKNLKSGFSGFLRQVLKWRRDSVRLLGGIFVKNSLLDYYQVLINDKEKIDFIKLEMLSRAKATLLGIEKKRGRFRGNREPVRRDDQYRWSFNGEFWNDEIGDYVFGLESKCRT